MKNLMQLENKYNKEVRTTKIISELHFEKLESDLEKALNLRDTLNQSFLRKEEIALVKLSMESYLGDTLTFRSESYSDELSQLKLRNENFISDSLKKLFEWLRSFFGGTSSSAKKAAEPTPKKEKETTKEKETITATDTKIITFGFTRTHSKKYIPVENFSHIGAQALIIVENINVACVSLKLFLASFSHILKEAKKYDKDVYKEYILKDLISGTGNINVGSKLPAGVLPDKWSRLEGSVLSLGWCGDWSSYSENYLFFIPNTGSDIKTFQNKCVKGEKYDELKNFKNIFDLEYQRGAEVKHTLELFEWVIEKIQDISAIGEIFNKEIDNLEKLAGSAFTEEEATLEENKIHFGIGILKSFINYFRAVDRVILDFKKDKEDNEDVWADYLKS